MYGTALGYGEPLYNHALQTLIFMPLHLTTIPTYLEASLDPPMYLGGQGNLRLALCIVHFFKYGKRDMRASLPSPASGFRGTR